MTRFIFVVVASSFHWAPWPEVNQVRRTLSSLKIYMLVIYDFPWFGGTGDLAVGILSLLIGLGFGAAALADFFLLVRVRTRMTLNLKQK